MKFFTGGLSNCLGVCTCLLGVTIALEGVINIPGVAGDRIRVPKFPLGVIILASTKFGVPT